MPNIGERLVSIVGPRPTYIWTPHGKQKGGNLQFCHRGSRHDATMRRERLHETRSRSRSRSFPLPEGGQCGIDTARACV